MAAFEDAAAWAQELERLGARIAPRRFGRVEPRRRALAYLRGLLAPVEDWLEGRTCRPRLGGA